VWLSSLLHPTRQNSTSIVLTADPTAKHLLSQERLPFTATYFGSIGLTLYFAVGVRFPPHSYQSSLPNATVNGSLITAVASRIQSSILQHFKPQASSSQARYPKGLVANSTVSHPESICEPPRLRYLNLPHRPPTLTLLFFSSLASERPAHFDLVDRPARRSRLVLGVVLPDGLPRLALRCAIRRQSAHRYAERLIRLSESLYVPYTEAYLRVSQAPSSSGMYAMFSRMETLYYKSRHGHLSSSLLFLIQQACLLWLSL
jgi:hypothetical protein